MLQLFLERLELLDRQIVRLDPLAAQAMKIYAEAVVRLTQVPGADSAQQLIAEIGPKAKSFPSAAQFSSWAGTCPGSEESAERNHSSRSPKGNVFLRRILPQVAQAAVKKKGSLAAQAGLQPRHLGHRPQVVPSCPEGSPRLTKKPASSKIECSAADRLTRSCRSRYSKGCFPGPWKLG
jgi:hypothetical protein